MPHHPQQILPGIWYWTAPHPRIGFEVASYWIDDGGVLVDPVLPPGTGIDWFRTRPAPPSAIVLSNRHHARESELFVERFACPVLVPRTGLHEFEGGTLAVTPYDPGDRLPGGLVVHEIGSLCPDDMALQLVPAGAVLFADGVVLGGPGGQENLLGFVPDSLMDDPPGTKRGLLAAVTRLLDETEFRHVLCAHGGPLLDVGRQGLEDLIAVGGRTAFEF